MIQIPKKLSKKNKFYLIILAIILNLVLRLPSVPHEIGNDSFQIHALANSITQFGFAKWWINIYSVFGLYTFSYASSVPFILSGISQLGNIDMETVVWMMGASLGLFSLFSSYLMASSLSKEFIFKFSFSLFYSLCQGILQFTVWDASSRGLFLVMFPLFFYLVANNNMSIAKKLIFVLPLLIFLRATHNFSYFAIFVVVSYICTKTVLSIDIISLSLRKHPRFYSILYLCLLISVVLFAFFTKFMMVGSRYGSVISLIITTTRYVGPVIFFAVSGLLYIIFKDIKNIKEWFILVTTMGFSLMFFSETYGKFILLPLIIYFVAVGFSNMLLFTKGLKNQKVLNVFIIIILLSFTAFSGYYNHYRTGDSQEFWYMKEQTNVAGIWTRTAMEPGSHILTTGGEVWRLFAISNGHAVFPTLTPLALTYGFINESEAINVTIPTKKFSKNYFFEGPYIQQSGTYFWGKYEWISNFPIDDQRTYEFIDVYDIKYIIFDSYAYGPIVSNADSVKSKIYDNNRITIYVANE